jgi:hypothetical protein
VRLVWVIPFTRVTRIFLPAAAGLPSLAMSVP